MGYVIIDRRLNGKGKSSVNRQKFFEKIRDHLREGVGEAVKNIDITDINKGSKKVKLPIRNMNEPVFSHDDQDGINHHIVTGNRKYVVGDRIPRPEQGDGQGDGEGSDSGDGEDDFEFTLTRDEFLDIYYDNCELPYIVRKTLSTSMEQEIQRQGYRSDGSPSTLNVVRSMRQAKSRNFSFKSGKNRRIKELQDEKLTLLEQVLDMNPVNETQLQDIEKRIVEIDTLIAELQRKIAAIPFLDPIDLRFNAWSQVDVPAIQAAMFCILDVSGSMDEEKKKIAKTFFMLLYLFLEQNYDHVELVFIRHHTSAEEVNEHEFFHSKESGGTLVSPALKMMLDIIDSRYSLSAWNIFVAQGSDGDNWGNDNNLVQQLLIERILPIVQYYAYTQINPGHDVNWRPAHDPWNMWGMFHEISKQHANLGASVITDSANVYSVFKKLFEKRAKVTA